ncbi:MAG: hypothetical protein LBG19_08590 [Prevotellaceae bacterium]|jgi:hypothetical protein|nr:hypothetical protein [Prevotellaceae bacterium]
MKLHFILLIAFISLIYSSIYAQNNQSVNLPNLIPPSPIAQELQKYIDYPISYATGIPEINIPLYTIEEKGFNIPISLSYHASGIKVGQSPYPIGLGWTLQPGFRISRMIRGKPDGAHLSESAKINEGNAINHVSASSIKYLAQMAPFLSSRDEQLREDGQHDIFHIYLPSYSDSFILQRVNGELQAVNIPESPLKISINYSDYWKKIEQFTVTDDQGIRYVFGSLGMDWECKEADERGNITSWMLKKIILPIASSVDNEVTFQYKKSGYPIGPSPALSLTDILYFPNDLYLTNCLISGEGNISEGFGYIIEHLVGGMGGAAGTQVCMLQSINFSGGRLLAHYNSLETHLDSIAVQDYLGNKRKDIRFGKSEDGEFLTSLYVSGIGSYQFYYNPLKTTNIYDQDYWGYYNQKSNQQNSLVPKIKWSTVFAVNPDMDAGRANRIPDEQAMKASMLEKIIYPTGGHTEFEYEANKYYDNMKHTEKLAGGLRIKKIKNYDNVSNQSIIREFKYGENEAGYAQVLLKMEDELFFKLSGLYRDYCEYYVERRDNEFILQKEFHIHAKKITALAYPHHSSYISTNAMVWYNMVTEYTDRHKATYKYSYTPNSFKELREGGLIKLFFTDTYRSLISAKPDLIELTQYKLENNGYTPIRQVKNIYNTLSSGEEYILGLIVEPYISYYEQGPDSGFMFDNTSWQSRSDLENQEHLQNFVLEPFLFSTYRIEKGIRQLTKTVTKDYTVEGTVSKTTAYKYDPQHPYNLIEKTETASDGRAVGERYHYSNNTLGDMGNVQRNLLEQSNRITTVMRKDIIQDEGSGVDVLYSEETEYISADKLILPGKFKTKSKGQAGWEDRIVYHSYDSYGNLTQISKAGDAPISYLWGYKGAYPVLQVVGESYANAISHLSTTELANIHNGSYAEAQLRQVLNKIRIAYQNQTQPVHVHTYTYLPLVGLTSEISSDGLGFYYQYDEFGRLYKKLDHQGSVVQQYEYHYVGPNP